MNRIDWELFAKLASGEGGNRTGAMMRAGLIRIEVTAYGRGWLETMAADGTLPEKLPDKEVGE